MKNERSELKFAGPMELLQAAFNEYRDRFKLYFGIIIAPAVTFFLFFGLSTALAKTFNVFILVLVISALGLFVLVQIWSQVALWIAIKEKKDGVGVKYYYEATKDKLFLFFWTSFLVGLITVGGFILFIIPGIIFMVWYVFATMLVVVEDTSGIDALRRSKEYVRGYFGGIAWRVFVFIFAILLVFIPLSIIFSEENVVANIVINLLGILVAPLYQVYLYKMYKNIKDLKNSSSIDISPELTQNNE